MSKINDTESELVAPNVSRVERMTSKPTAGKGFRADFDFRNNRNCAPVKLFSRTCGTVTAPTGPLNKK